MERGYLSLVLTCLVLCVSIGLESYERDEIAHTKTSLASIISTNPRRLSGQQNRQTVLQSQDDVVDSLHRVSTAIERLSVVSLGTTDDALSSAKFQFTYHGGFYGTASFFDVVSTSMPLSASSIGPFENTTSFIEGEQERCPVTEQLGVSFVPCRGATLAEVFDRLESFAVSFRVDTATSAFATVTVQYSFMSHRSSVTQNVMVNFCSSGSSWMTVLARVSLVVAALATSLLCYQSPWMFHSASKWLHTSMGLHIVTSVASITLQLTEECETHRSEWDLLRAVAILSLFSVLFFETLYISYFDSIRRTLLVVGPRVGAYVIGVLPIFMGYALCGMALFGGHDLFSTLGDSCLTLFCALFGDSLIDIFTVIDQNSSAAMQWTSKIYFVSFLLLFITNMLNIGLSVVQDAFAAAQKS